jgi:hypothetical protein
VALPSAHDARLHSRQALHFVSIIRDLLGRRHCDRRDRHRGTLIHHAFALALAVFTHPITMVVATIRAALMPSTSLAGVLPTRLGAAPIPAVRVPAVAARADEEHATATAARAHTKHEHVPVARRWLRWTGRWGRCRSLDAIHVPVDHQKARSS